ncbi:hypothetical protein QQ008_26350 [Fulvivirgaceae bacterium BMA10]|uniref:Uncharacterized protein n=1 Tax=Splendidivirga corallicola TaxID=3051826 RepID=A0ABT8KVY7_9BACT|nr:hypothetical protein [Fulvivirgaceae bacterium BMA10]
MKQRKKFCSIKSKELIVRNEECDEKNKLFITGNELYIERNEGCDERNEGCDERNEECNERNDRFATDNKCLVMKIIPSESQTKVLICKTMLWVLNLNNKEQHQFFQSHSKQIRNETIKDQLSENVRDNQQPS